jgi:hypothetical protein
MQAHSSLSVRPAERGVDPWLLLTGGSVGLVAGLAADLWRMGLCRARATLAAGRGQPCSGHCG